MKSTRPATVSMTFDSKVPSDLRILALSFIKAFFSTLPSLREITTSLAFEKIEPSPLIVNSFVDFLPLET